MKENTMGPKPQVSEDYCVDAENPGGAPTGKSSDLNDPCGREFRLG
jgi:hypothetical protein